VVHQISVGESTGGMTIFREGDEDIPVLVKPIILVGGGYNKKNSSTKKTDKKRGSKPSSNGEN